MLAERGFRVVRFDNRDIGHSTKLEWAPVPANPGDAARAAAIRPTCSRDMAADAVGLMDHLGIECAHVVGASMGGMIAQTMAIEHPRAGPLAGLDHVDAPAAAGSVPRLPRLRRAARQAGPHAARRSIRTAIKTFEVIGSPGLPADEERLREAIGAAYDRGHYRPGVARQLHAINASRRPHRGRCAAASAGGRDPRRRGPPRPPGRRPRHAPRRSPAPACG